MQQLENGTLLQGGRYKIINAQECVKSCKDTFLGQGGFGITYLAIQSGLERKVAIKEFFMKELCNRDESTSHVTLGTEGSRETVNRFREKFLKEARNIAKLNHPNIVRIIDVFEENGTAYYVMEYAENGSLADKVKNDGYLSEPVATRYILQVADALNYVHQQKMNHLDIKPANIMIDAKDECILIDFGLSKQYDAKTGDATSTNITGLSEGYAPLEQYDGSVKSFAPEIDIYALGATFFKMLTGNTPPTASIVNNEGLPVEELEAKGVSKNTIRIIEKAMEGRKKDRMKDVRIFADALKKNNSSGQEEIQSVTDSTNETISFDSKTILEDTNENTFVKTATDYEREEIGNSNSSTGIEIDKAGIAYEVADLIVNQGYDKDSSVYYLTKEKNVPENLVEEILTDAAVLVRQSNKEAGWRDVGMGLFWLVLGIALTVCLDGKGVFYGPTLYGGYLVFRGCKSLFTSQVYGRSKTTIWKIILCIIAILLVILGVQYLFNSNSKQEEFISAQNKIIGYGVDINVKEGTDVIENLAKDGYGPALYHMYESYLYGKRGFEMDTLKAKDYLMRANNVLEKEAEDGDKVSQYYLAHTYLYGIGKKVDGFKAEKWIRESADKEYIPAETLLGWLYLNDKNKADESFSILEKAAETKFPYAVYLYAYCFANGIGTEQDSAKFVNLLEVAVDMKEDNAMRDLGALILYTASTHITHDATEGMHYLIASSNNGNVNAKMDLAYCLLNGIGCERDIDKAIEYLWPIVTNLKNSVAQLFLGYCYDGKDLYHEAVNCYRLSANQGNSTALYQLSIHYREGLGVTRSDAYAEEYYKAALSKGYIPEQ